MQKNLAVTLTIAIQSLAEKLLTLGLSYCESHPLCLLIPYLSKRILSSKVLEALMHWYVNHYIPAKIREVHKELKLTDKTPNKFLRWKKNTED